jgi:hypothetical protein
VAFQTYHFQNEICPWSHSFSSCLNSTSQLSWLFPLFSFFLALPTQNYLGMTFLSVESKAQRNNNMPSFHCQKLQSRIPTQVQALGTLSAQALLPTYKLASTVFIALPRPPLGSSVTQRAFRVTHLASIPVRSFLWALVKKLDLSEPQFPHMYNRHDTIIF